MYDKMLSIMRGLFFALCFLSLYGDSLCYIEKPGPRYPPTKGEVWPHPQNQNVSNTQFLLTPGKFEFKIIGDNTCPPLLEAIDRYYGIIDLQAGVQRGSKARARFQKIYEPSENQPMALDSITQLQIEVTGPCEQWPTFEMDEEYFLEVAKDSSKLTSKSLWGALRGLETFSQLLHRDATVTLNKDLVINATQIQDFPRFPHRGILLDTSRHYVSVKNILLLLDGMAYNKLNVFHWHIVDDQSFPYVSKQFPSLSEEGAYHPSYIYTPEAVASVVEYARVRGIRVMAEFDTPGHTRSWGVAYPKLLTECYGSDGKPNGDLGPMDPSEDFVYSFMEQLLAEIVTVFPDRYFHIGGDEVDFDCWQSNPKIKDFMNKFNITEYNALEEYYIQRVVDMVDKLNSKSVVWQEVYLNGVKLPMGTVVHVWTGNQQALLNKITNDGLPALLSACWYLDHLANGGDWEKFYLCDPHNFSGSDAQKKLVLGGEACMWSEVVDNNNVISRIFPRASASAEKLWSAHLFNNGNLKNRMEEQYCRMNIRGIQAQPPSGPGFCPP